MEISAVRNRLNRAMDAARVRAQRRREQVAASEAAYAAFVQDVATPLVRQLASCLKAERHPFSVSTPGQDLSLSSDLRRDDSISFFLDTDADPPQVMARIVHARGSRTLTEDRAVAPGTPIHELSDEHVLTFLLGALEPWLER
jgi:hypothetical protein